MINHQLLGRPPFSDKSHQIPETWFFLASWTWGNSGGFRRFTHSQHPWPHILTKPSARLSSLGGGWKRWSIPPKAWSSISTSVTCDWRNLTTNLLGLVRMFEWLKMVSFLKWIYPTPFISWRILSKWMKTEGTTMDWKERASLVPMDLSCLCPGSRFPLELLSPKSRPSTVAACLQALSTWIEWSQ